MRLKAFATHFLTAVATAAVTSAFWIIAYSNVIDAEPSRPPPPERAAPAARTDVNIAPGGLAIPVSGIEAAALADTFTQARAGGARVHDAIDIMAPAGTPVVAAAAGRVEKLFFSEGGGGITAYVRSPDNRLIFYYAHLRDYAPGLREGQRIARGDPIGTVGSTGNASPAGPHLHFAIHRMGRDDKWYGGRPLNPYPLLAGKR